MKKLSLIITAVLLSVIVRATESFVLFHALPLQSVTIGFSAQEHACVQRAAASLQADFERVTGIRPATSDEPTILIGTVGVNKQIDQWVKQGVLRDLKGKTEKYILKTIGNQLVIAGSDKRGTVFGIYELSQQIGVSPWYWWADVPVVKHTDLYVKKGEYSDGEPQVRYRGLFLNDEAPCLTTWVKNTFGTNYGDHRFYEKVFELVLRLKGNFLWLCRRPGEPEDCRCDGYHHGYQSPRTHGPQPSGVCPPSQRVGTLELSEKQGEPRPFLP